MSMTKGELLKMLEREANEYRAKALDSVRRNCHMNSLTEADMAEVRKNPNLFRRFADAILVDFVNQVGANQGLDYGLNTKHFKSQIKKQK